MEKCLCISSPTSAAAAQFLTILSILSISLEIALSLRKYDIFFNLTVTLDVCMHIYGYNDNIFAHGVAHLLQPSACMRACATVDSAIVDRENPVQNGKIT